MYSLVLLLAATTNAETTSCHRFRSCCPPPCCPTPPPCCGTAPAAPAPGVTPIPPPGKKMMPAGTKLSAAEEKQLAELILLLKKGGKMTPAELKQYDEWYRTITPAERTKEFKEMTATPAGVAPLSKDEEKMLKDLLTQFGTKDKDGAVKYDAKALKQYEQWFREQTPAERSKEYKNEYKPATKTPDTKDKKGSQLNAPARILVHLPADARLTIDGNATKSTSSSRLFNSPTLNAQGLHFYEFQAIVERNGMQITINRLVRVQAGATTEVNIEIPEIQHVMISQR
jgi:uncharacterized protein (TIGR03000 family)